jgi:hypothetical protein
MLNVFNIGIHNILEPVLDWSSKEKSNTIVIPIFLVEPLESRLHVSLKWKKHTCRSEHDYLEKE